MKVRPQTFANTGIVPGTPARRPIPVHFERGVDSQFKKLRTRIDQFPNALPARSVVPFCVGVDGFGSATRRICSSSFLNFFQQIDDAAGILFRFRRFQIRTVSERNQTREVLTQARSFRMHK